MGDSKCDKEVKMLVSGVYSEDRVGETWDTCEVITVTKEMIVRAAIEHWLSFKPPGESPLELFVKTIVDDEHDNWYAFKNTKNELSIFKV